MEALKTGVRADQNPTVPTEEEKIYLRERSRQSAEILDDMPGLSETEAKILEQVVEGYSYESGFQKPLTQDEYLGVIQNDINGFLQMIKSAIPGSKAPVPQVKRWLRGQKASQSYYPSKFQAWPAIREKILLEITEDEMLRFQIEIEFYKNMVAEKLIAEKGGVAIQMPEYSGIGKNMSSAINTTSLPDQNGQMTALSQYFNQPGKDLVLVSLWATWCGPCKAEIPYLNNVAKKYPNVTVLGLAQEDSQEDLAAGVKTLKAKPKYPILLDATGKAKDRLAPQAQGIPHLMFFSNDGTLLKEETGFGQPSDGSNPIAGEVEGLLKESKEAPLDEQGVETVTP